MIWGGHKDNPKLVLSPSVFEKYFFESSFPHKSCQWVTAKVSLQGYHWFFNRVSLFRSSAGRHSHPLLWALFLKKTVWGMLTSVPAHKLTARRWPHPPCQGVWTFVNVTAATCEADAPCCVNAALNPLPSFDVGARVSVCISGNVWKALSVSDRGRS